MVMKFFAAALLSLLVSACATQPETASPPNPLPPLAAVPKADPGAALVRQAGEAVAAKKPAEALLLADKAIAYYEGTYRRNGVIAYAARSAPESLFYAVLGPKEKTSVHVYGIDWSLAYFLKGFALVDLHRIPEARAAYDAAIQLSPRNSAYLSERAETDIAERHWQSALEIFQRALDTAEISPPDRKTAETTRALRGMAFAQIELGNLDAAKALHERVLQLEPGNEKSLHELRYIQQQKARKT
jgi:tetratricopeptide (TPR) repeat protein